jgi:hypothetical protein
MVILMQEKLDIVQRCIDAKDDRAALTYAVQAQMDHPTDSRPKIALGRVHMAANRFRAALLPLQQAEALDPSAKVWIVLAECHNRLDNWFEAERYYQKVLAAEPNNVIAITNLEPLVREQGRYDESRALLQRVPAILPTVTDAVTTSIACLDLAEGNLADGFRGYEARFRGFHHLWEAYGEPYFPRWTGTEDLTGKAVLIRFEQGLGDTIQFVRYAKHLKQRGARHVGVMCKPVLHRLLLTVPDVDAVMETQPKELYDFEVMLMSMPALINTTCEADIPGDPYLSVARKDAKHWAKKLAKFKRLKVGLVWSGELKLYKWDSARMNLRRSIPLDLFRPILDVECDFFSLQKGERQADLKDFYATNPIHDFMDDCHDFYDTACLIANLDLVIAVDTSTAHAAGALGKPVWMLNRLDGCWRWLHNRSDSPWYPSLTVYRQDQYCEWRPVIARLAGDLRDKINTP